MEPPPLPRVVRFGVFEVDRRSRELRKRGLRIKLHEQPFRVLELLLERPGELITREEFQRQIWPADTFVDFDLGLNTAIKRLRLALGDSAATPRFVETLPRRGYRFVFPVNGGAPAASEAGIAAVGQPVVAAEELVSGPEPMPPAVAVTPGSRWVAAGLWILLATAAAGSAYVAFGRPASGSSDIHSIAVLPFDNLSADPEQEYFADGMTDEIVTDLAKLGTFGVISRGSVLRYKHSRRPLPEIAKELDVDAVVEGTVMRSGQRVRITAQVIRARTDQHLWADDFEREVGDVVALQDDVAGAIANAIQRKLTPGQRARVSARRQVDQAAYDAYLRGQYIFQRRTPESVDSAIRYYTLAIEKDPNFAPAYAALADCYTMGMFVHRPLPPREAWARAAQSATKALQLDDDLAEAHVALAGVRYRYDWNWAAAEREYKRAIELNPNSAPAHQNYSVFLNLMRRTDEGAAAASKAEHLDPLSPSMGTVVSWSYAYARRYDEAIRHAQRTLELDPNYAPAHNLLARSYDAKGMWEQAVSEYLKVFSSQGMDANTVLEFRQAFDTGGTEAFRRKWLDLAEVRLRHGDRPALIDLARLSYLLGDKDASFGWLERAYKERDPGLANIYWAADWLDGSRSDPRYIALSRRMGLPQ